MTRITQYDLNGNKVSERVEDTTLARFMIKGRKMYIWKIEDMLDVLSKEEFKTILKIYDDNRLTSRGNVLLVPFNKATLEMKTVARSRFKKKLLTNGLAIEYENRIMLNPYIFVPRNDKNIENFQHLVQRTYKYLSEDKDLYFEGIDDFVKEIFNT